MSTQASQGAASTYRRSACAQKAQIADSATVFWGTHNGLRAQLAAGLGHHSVGLWAAPAALETSTDPQTSGTSDMTRRTLDEGGSLLCVQCPVGMSSLSQLG